MTITSRYTPLYIIAALAVVGNGELQAAPYDVVIYGGTPVAVTATRADSLGVALVARGGTAKVTSLEAWDLFPTNSW